MKPFKKFLYERSDFQGEGGEYEDGDENEKHLTDYTTHLINVIKNTPYSHETQEGTHRFKSLFNALNAHASVGYHGTFLKMIGEKGNNHAPTLDLANKMRNSYTSFGDLMIPHAENAIRKTQSKLLYNNPLKKIPSSALVSGLFEGMANTTAQNVHSVLANLNMDPMRYALHIIPIFKQHIDEHEHKPILRGGHYGLLVDDDAEDPTGVFGNHARAEFFPKWNK